MDKIKAAKQVVFDLCKGGRFVMCVPVQEDDTDMVLMAGLNEGVNLQTRVIKLWLEGRLSIPLVCEILGCTYDELYATYHTAEYVKPAAELSKAGNHYPYLGIVVPEEK